MAKNDNWVVMPVHNNAAMVDASIRSLLAQDIGNIRIFAINNDSSDNSAQVLNSFFPRVVTIHYSPQKGVAGAWNFALQYLFEKLHVDRALVVNSDILLRSDTYRLLDESGHDFVTTVSTNEIEKLSGPVLNTEPRPHPDFSCFLIRRGVWYSVGRFDEAYYPAWFEDNDYHVRMFRAGVSAVCLDIPFYHVGGATIKTAEAIEIEYLNACFDKNKKRFYDTYGCYPGTKEYEQLFETEETKEVEPWWCTFCDCYDCYHSAYYSSGEDEYGVII